MRYRNIIPVGSAVIVLSLVMSIPAYAAQSLVTLRATQDILLADGKQQTVITAEVHDSNGRPVNGTAVEFQTTAGTLTQTRVPTFNGLARTRLISATVPGVAHITAIAEGGSPGAANVLDIEFTNDPEDTFEGNSFMLATGSYLAYSVTDQTIEARGENGTGRLTYRNFEVSADRLQLKCDENAILRAIGHITLRRGKDVVHGSSLYYSLTTGQGYAVAEWKGKLQEVAITGEHLTLAASPGRIPPSYLTLPELQVRLIVVARSIAYFPGEKLQFRKPRFFQEQVQILSLPYYEMRLDAQELFSDHFISVGSHGLGLEVPFYYNLTPSSSGIVYLRHQAQLGRGFYSTDPGWGIDLMQSYNSTGSHRYEGSYGFTSLLHGDWSFQWTHTHEFNEATQGAFSLEFPHHDSVFSSANLSQQEKLFRIGLDFSGGQNFIGSRESQLNTNAYIESNPHPFLGIRGMQFVLGTKLSTGYISGIDPTNPLLKPASDTSEEVTMRAFTRPIVINKQTSLNTSFTVGQIWSSRLHSGFEGLATVALNHTLPRGGALNLSYDYVSAPSDIFDPGAGKHRVSLVYQVAGSKHFQASFIGSTYLDTPTTSLIADAAYRLTSDWRVIASATMQRDSIASYKDFELTLGRRIGSRELQLTYSTYLKRISLDITSTQW